MYPVDAEHTHGKWGITHTHPHTHTEDKPCSEMRAHIHHLTVFDAIEMKVTHHTTNRPSKRGPYHKSNGLFSRQYLMAKVTVSESPEGSLIITIEP